MQYHYEKCNLPSNGKIYPIKEVHLRPKTIFDIKSLLNNPVFYLQSEIDALQNCIDPKDNIDVYDLVNQDVVYLLYKLRSLSDDNLMIKYKNKDINAKISELEIKVLDSWNNERTLPESGIKVVLNASPIKNIFHASEQYEKFRTKYPDYNGDVASTVALLNAILMINNVTDKDNIRNILESLSWKDSVYLVEEIEKFQQLNFGVIEEVEVDMDDGDKIKIPIQLAEGFFRSAQ